MTFDDLRKWADFNRGFLNQCAKRRRAGTSVDDLAKSWRMPEKYKGYAAPAPERLQANVENIYKESR